MKARRGLEPEWKYWKVGKGGERCERSVPTLGELETRLGTEARAARYRTCTPTQGGQPGTSQGRQEPALDARQQTTISSHLDQLSLRSFYR